MGGNQLDPAERLAELERKVERLESELAAMRGTPTRTAIPGPSAGWAAPPSTPAWAPPAPPAPPSTQERTPIAFDGEVALKWGGVGLVVLAVGFAVSTAISRGWIGPELQLVGAAAVSLGLVATGLRLQSTRPAWTHALGSAGVAAAFTTVASNLFLDQATDAVAFWSTAVIGLVGFVLARHVPSEWIGAVTLSGGVIGWLVIGRDDPPVFGSLIWFALAVAIAIWLSVDEQWFALRGLAHLAGLAVIVRVAAETDRFNEQLAVMVVASALLVSMATVPSIGDLRSVWHQLEVQLVLVLAPWAFGVTAITFELDRDVSVGWTAIGAAAVVAAIAGLLRSSIGQAHLVSLVAGSSVATSIGVAVLLDTTVIFVALAVQAAALVLLNRRLGGSVRVAVNAAILVSIAVAYDVGAMVDAWSDDARIVDDLAHLAIIVVIAITAWLTRSSVVERVGAVGVLAMTMIWLGSVLVHLPQGQAAVSASWAVVGTAVLLAGALRRQPDVGAVGLTVLAVTVAKLLTVDLREVDTLWRAGLFFVIGLGFLRLGFLLPRFAARPPIDGAPSEPDPDLDPDPGPGPDGDGRDPTVAEQDTQEDAVTVDSTSR